MSDRRFNPKGMAKLDSPERTKLLPPKEILSALNIEKGDTIADLGAGTGYFTIPASRQTESTVFAVDIEPQMLNVLEERLTAQHISNAELIKGPIESIPMDDQSVDKVIASMVLHEVEPLTKGLQEIKRILKPGGLCICVEWEKEQAEQGPPLHHRIHSSDMKQVVEQEGFQVINVFSPSESVYVMTFQS